MKFNTLLSTFGHLSFFDLSTVLQMLGGERASVRVQLSRWLRAGKLLSLRRGLYAFADPYRKIAVHPLDLANQLYKPSYLSSLWVLGFMGLIPEKVVTYTSITPRVPRRFANAFGRFHYSNIKQSYFFGFSKKSIQGMSVWMAEPEKALLDLWHLNKGPWSLPRMQEMRFQNVELVDLDRLKIYAARFNAPRLTAAVGHWCAMAGEEVDSVLL